MRGRAGGTIRCDDEPRADRSPGNPRPRTGRIGCDAGPRLSDLPDRKNLKSAGLKLEHQCDARVVLSQGGTMMSRRAAGIAEISRETHISQVNVLVLTPDAPVIR